MRIITIDHILAHRAKANCSNKFIDASEYVIPLPVFVDGSQSTYKVYFERKRWRIYTAKDFKCIYCGLMGTHAVFWKDHVEIPWDAHCDLVHITPEGRRILMTLDHLFPKSQGGTNDPANLAVACSPCNHTKGDNVVDIFMNL